VLTGKYKDGAWPDGARFTLYKDHSPRTKVMVQRFLGDRAREMTDRVHELAASCEMDPVTFAVAWTLTKKFVGSTIIGVTHPDQLDPHLAAAEAKIPDEALQACDRLAREIPYPLG
jgi:aryl-alcohol dehydrogenase-like predicted oxidoreductase